MTCFRNREIRGLLMDLLWPVPTPERIGYALYLAFVLGTALTSGHLFGLAIARRLFR